MDHKWGRWVTEVGLGCTGCTITSSMTVSTGIAWITNHNPSPGFFDVWVIPTDTSLPFVRTTQNKLPGHPHFPYGRVVAADGPA